MSNQPEVKLLASRKHWSLLIVGAVSTSIMGFLSIRVLSDYTPAAIMMLIVLPLFTYSVILGFIALIIALVRRSIRKHWFVAFAWLFFIAGMSEIAVKGYTVFVLWTFLR